MAQSTIDKEKTVHALLYLCDRLNGSWDMYGLLKILFFAECYHLVKYGRTITGDRIVAMEFGPVPSLAYDKVKLKSIDKKYFEHREGSVIVALQKPDTEYLSETDMDCLEESIQKNSHYSFGEMKNRSHVPAYEEIKQAYRLPHDIPYQRLAQDFGANADIIAHIDIKQENSLLI